MGASTEAQPSVELERSQRRDHGHALNRCRAEADAGADLTSTSTQYGSQLGDEVRRPSPGSMFDGYAQGPHEGYTRSWRRRALLRDQVCRNLSRPLWNRNKALRMPFERADDAKTSSAVASHGLLRLRYQRPAKVSARNRLSVYAAEQNTDAALKLYRSVATDAARSSCSTFELNLRGI